MADWYCDVSKVQQGDYGMPGVVVASTSGSSTTLTVASTTSGNLSVGQYITGTGIAPRTQITAIGTYNGTSGTVTMSVANTVAASTTVTAQGGPYPAGTVPARAEDGNGMGTGIATMATLVITFTGIPAASGTITIGGVTFTAVASGATGNQFNAVTDATTCATNLRNAINASTTNLVNPTPGQATTPLRNVVNATSSAGVVTVYSRIGGTEWNSVTETETLTNCSITSQWSGGGNGAWGYFVNPWPIGWPTSVGVYTYGGVEATYLGNPAAGDVIHIRTGRSNADITVENPGHAAASWTTRATGTINAYLEIRFDNGVIWNDGNSNGVFTLSKTNTNLNAVMALGGFTYLRGQMQSGVAVNSGGTVNFKQFHNQSIYSSAIQAQHTLSGGALVAHSIIEGLETANGGAGSSLLAVFGSPKSWNHAAVFRNCKFGHVYSAAQSIFGLDNVFGASYDAYDCLFAFGAGATYTSALFNANATRNHTARLFRPKFTGGNGGHHCLMVFDSTQVASNVIQIEDPVDMGQFLPSDSAASFCGRASIGSGSGYGPVQDQGSGQWVTSNASDRQFLIDTPLRLLEWRTGAGFPTTGLSVLPGNTPFSVRFSPSPVSALAISPALPVRGVRQVVVNTLTDGSNLTLTWRGLIDSFYGNNDVSAYTPAANDFWIEGTYIDATSGLTKTYSTKGTALASDSATSWSSTSFGPFGGTARNLDKWKATASLTNVKTDTEVTCFLMCGKRPFAMTQWVFIDPQFQLA